MMTTCVARIDPVQARIDPKLIMRAKKLEKKAANGRLLEPLQKKKLPPGEKDKEEEEAEKEKQKLAKPKTPEEYEAWRWV